MRARLIDERRTPDFDDVFAARREEADEFYAR